jgi:LmbE family N-acetylglucosaminyl deacetylase
MLDIPDQETVFNLPWIALELARIAEGHGIALFLTHAFEGGHADHDATAFAVHGAAALCPEPLPVVEMPFYHWRDGRMVHQRFAASAPGETVLRLDPRQRALKRRMLSAHRTQREVLNGFALDVERFRPAPAYDFSSPRNDGADYARIAPSITADLWRDRVGQAEAVLRRAKRAWC